MCIIAKQQICVHIDRITCLSSYPMGRYALRFFLSYKHNHSKKYAIPISIIDDPCRQNPGSEIQENAYKTKEFLMKPNTMVYSASDFRFFSMNLVFLRINSTSQSTSLTTRCSLLVLLANLSELIQVRIRFWTGSMGFSMELMLMMFY